MGKTKKKAYQRSWLIMVKEFSRNCFDLEVTMYYPKHPQLLYYVDCVKDQPKIAIVKLIDLGVKRGFFSGKKIISYIVRWGVVKRNYLEWGDLDKMFVGRLLCRR